MAGSTGRVTQTGRMFRKFQEAVNRKPVANGLAIIVACEHGVKAEHNYLPGTRRDLETMKQTFERLKFTTFSVLNPSKDKLIKVIQAAVSIRYPSMPAYGRLVFHFSGHGDDNFIYTHDGAVDLHEEVYPPFLPKKSPHLAKVSKFFFLDTCRGSGTDEGVRIRQFRARGGGDDGERTTSTGNYLLACSTLPTKKSFENLSGGFWTQELASQLCNPENIEMSVSDILGKVNATLVKKMSDFPSLQQPVWESTLNTEGPIKFLKEARNIGESCSPTKSVGVQTEISSPTKSVGVQTEISSPTKSVGVQTEISSPTENGSKYYPLTWEGIVGVLEDLGLSQESEGLKMSLRLQHKQLHVCH